MWFLQRNLMVLFGCQMASISGSVVMVTLGGIIGGQLAETPSLATLPVSLVIVGTALSSAPAALLMSRWGRKPVFLLGISVALTALLMAYWSVTAGSFIGFCLALFGFGVNMACVQQYRFAAAESVPTTISARALSFIMLAPIGGALLGPELLSLSARFFGAGYAPVFLMLAVLMGAALVVMALLGPLQRERGAAQPGANHSSTGFSRSTTFWLAVAAGVSAYGVMALIMTATPISMHTIDGHGMDVTAGVIRSHVVAMYLPSLAFATLVRWFAVRRVIAAGLTLFVAVVLLALLERSLLHYWLVLVLLGVGWNFLYLGGTHLLTTTFPGEERFRAQATNEFAVFATSALASLASGAILFAYGWRTMAVSVAPLLILTLAMLVLEASRRPSPVRS
ncbi:MAG: MFS transporter [Woeseiaceae bacterium]